MKKIIDTDNNYAEMTVLEQTTQLRLFIKFIIKPSDSHISLRSIEWPYFPECLFGNSNLGDKLIIFCCSYIGDLINLCLPAIHTQFP